MHSFPGFLLLQNRPVLVVGGGAFAARKIRLLLKAGAAVTVAAPQVNAEIAGRAAAGQVQHRAVSFSPALLNGMRLVVSAAGDAIDEAVAAAARERGIWVNVVDRADLSDFIVPAIVERGDITIGIGSNGKAPLLLGRIRAQIETLLPSRLGDLAALAGECRATVSRILPDAAQRRHFWERIFDGAAASRILAGDKPAARAALLAELNAPQPQRQGVVHIVGAGPGDPDLLTIAALRILQDADIVLHDDLVAPAILDRLRRDAERVCVGKRKGRHSFSQAAINALMAEQAASGRRVVRLKAGDPFIFGRGGEEAAYLQARGIAVHVVPGITAALGCAAAAGIPLTHRDLSHGVTLVSGHLQDDEDDALFWAERARQGETVVVYMGASQAAAIRARLLQAGAAATLPVALIENGTRPDQVVSAGTLDDLPALAARHGQSETEPGPVLLVIGKVAAMARAKATRAMPQLTRRRA
ncbi:MAG TPA: siroheme synthase CysG [Ferrovibrio sp.]|uniref:siroheme synthase CysG n=1 Tax=Ferrovibrio sp. TaxID=1917215 RepID=UPI002ED3A297